MMMVVVVVVLVSHGIATTCAPAANREVAGSRVLTSLLDAIEFELADPDPFAFT